MNVTLRFSHLALNCRDMTATERFYTRHFGFRRARVIPLGDQQIVFLRSGEVLLELFQAEGEAAAAAVADGPHGSGSIRHLAFQTEDVDALIAAVGDEAQVTLGPLDFGDFIPGWRTAWLRDPDGVIVEVSQGYVDRPGTEPMSTREDPAA